MRARAVVNATGVWAGDLVEEVNLRPSRGTHVVLRADTLPGLSVAVFAPVPGEANRFVLVLPQPDGTIYVGLTDEPVEGEVPDVPEPTEPEIGFLLDVVSAAFAQQLRRSDVIGAYAGLRPLLDYRSEGSTADLSRKHAVLTSTTGVVTIVGGKLTTYRRMAEDAVDAAIVQAGLPASPCRTRTLPLLGAAPRPSWPRWSSRRAWCAASAPTPSWCSPPPARSPACRTTSCWPPSPTTSPPPLPSWCSAVTHEGAADVDDLLDRRTRIGLVPADRERAVAAAERALALAGRPAQTATSDDFGQPPMSFCRRSGLPL